MNPLVNGLHLWRASDATTATQRSAFTAQVSHPPTQHTHTFTERRKNVHTQPNGIQKSFQHSLCQIILRSNFVLRTLLVDVELQRMC